MSSFRGRRTSEQLAAEAVAKREALKLVDGDRQSERSEMALVLIAIAKHIADDKLFDARRVYRLDIEIDSNTGNNNATVITHSRVAPTHKIVVPGEYIDNFVNGKGEEVKA